MKVNLILAVAGLLISASVARAENEEFESCVGKAENSSIRAVNCDLAIRLGGLNPGQLAAAHYTRGRAYLDTKRPEKALNDFNEVLKVDPNSPIALVNRGLVYRQLKQLDLAIADFNLVLEIGFEPAAPTYFNRGMTYRQMGNAERALADLRKAQELDPQNTSIAEALWETERFFKYR